MLDSMSDVDSVVRPTLLPSASLSSALRLAAVMAAVKLILHLGTNLWQAHIGFGFHRDELYYLICSQRLAWGYVDQAPLVALQAWLALHLFGDSLAGIRLLSAAAGAGRVLLTGVLCWQSGGRRGAQFLAMLCVLMAPQYLGLDSFLSMNSFESLFWIGLVVVIVAMQKGLSLHFWLLAAALTSAGLLNKPSMVFFLVPLLIALLFGPQRRLLHSRYFALAIVFTLLAVAPYLYWQYSHAWPTWQWLRFVKTAGKDPKLTLLDYIQAPIDLFLPITLPVWFGGLVRLLYDKRKAGMRWLGVTFLLFWLLMWRLGAKDYYIAPIYPVLFAAGGVLWERVFDRKPLYAYRTAALALFSIATVIYGLIVLPMAIPLFSATAWPSYLHTAHQHTDERKDGATSVFPQWYADRFGWKELAQQVRVIVDSLPAEERSRLGILCDNYGEASAINFWDRHTDVPFAMSGHNTYYFWGTGTFSGNILLLVTSQTEQQLRTVYASVKPVGKMNCPQATDYEQKVLYLVSGRVEPLRKAWPSYRWYY